MLASFAAALAPVFTLIALGFLAVRSGYLTGADTGALGRFVIGVALPALIFVAVAGAPLGETLVSGLLIAYGAAALLAFGFFRARAARDEAPALQALGMSLSNSGYVGLPVALMVLGDGAVRILAHGMIVESMVILPLALALCEWQRRTGVPAAASRRASARSLPNSCATRSSSASRPGSRWGQAASPCPTWESGPSACSPALRRRSRSSPSAA
jgi:malonate transporter and related proteins